MPPVESFSLRPATLEDLPKLLAIEARSHSAPWAEEHFLSELAKPYARVLLLSDDETDERVAGYIVYWVAFDECQILNVTVDPEYRGLGFGRRLVGQAVREAIQKEMKRVTLDVRKSNEAAIHLYQACKFVISHVRKTFYSDGEDAYQMDLFLGEGAQLPEL